MGTSSHVYENPFSGLLIPDEEKEKKILNSIRNINFKDLFMESLTLNFLNYLKKILIYIL